MTNVAGILTARNRAGRDDFHVVPNHQKKRLGSRPCQPSVAGSGHLSVELVAGQSTATSVWANSPLKILTPRPRGPSVWAYLSSLGGGLVGGDEIKLTLEVGEQASCFLGTQSSTKVYRNPNCLPCSQSLRATLGSGAFLAFVPDPVQPFLEARYSQRQEFHLALGSGLVLVDWLCSGRAARGERWAFSRFQSRNEVFLDDSRVLLDSLLLDPADGSLTGAHRMGRFNCLALVLLIGAPLKVFAERLLAEFAGQTIERSRATLVSSVSPVPHGALLRLAGENAETVGGEIQRLLSFLPQFLSESPWSRKW